MKRFTLARRAAAIGLLIGCSLVMLQSRRSAAQQDDALATAQREARHAMEEFYRVFNEADNEALQEFMNFPHVFLSANGRVSISEERWTMNFDGMRERENWASSSLDSAKACLVMETKVHFDIVFSRHHADGSTYRTVPGMWIVTKQDDHWGVQLRSY